MEAILLRSSSDQSISPYKQFRNSGKNYPSVVPRLSENHAPFSYFHGGLLHAPPHSLFYSYPPSVSVLNPQQQPPLLPLPIPNPNNNDRTRGLSCPPINRKINGRSREHKKSKSPKKADPKRDLKSIPSASSLGPDPKDVSRVLSSAELYGNYGDLESSGVFTLSPPPSSLPLPTFSLKPKLSCKAEVAGIDAGVTDNLRRILPRR
ncbi:hypothetical protein CEY00_Acc04538 [Actinidia chinensis var. chinensis]|uniref:Uncharacterized protein n=1 Tax=Actinidia chinensis var. chinensis TaxID=1590841 RepID=A0A2R6RMK1_ACTCC|nr:hypothetical protein CEY00_Acc04538 [Actinidia chinensis var. chinensis]